MKSRIQFIMANPCWAAAFLLAIALTLGGANRKLVSPVDASIRASIAREIVETGDLYPPKYDGEVLVDHPPLYIWATAASFKVFGTNDFAASLPGRLSALGCLLLVFFIARRLGLSDFSAFLATFILASTRDFILISMQGGIEPLLSFWCWLEFFLLIVSLQSRKTYLEIFAGLSVVLAAFSKGPPALWPFVFAMALILFYPSPFPHRVRRLANFFIGVAAGAAIWGLWIKESGLGWYWSRYWTEQVMGSALQGRGHHQGFEPLYFTKILFTQYWPWIPFLIFSVYSLFRAMQTKAWHQNLFARSGFWAFFYALGFFGGFSLVSWKFWYYIAPAFPGFALLIASQLESHKGKLKFLKAISESPRFPVGVIAISLMWIFVTSVLPLNLSGNSMPEIQVFKETLLHSPVPGPVWFVHHPGDHNMYGTSGNWYFHRIVKNVLDEAQWEQSIKGSTWVLTGSEYFKTCKQQWCGRIHYTQTIGPSTLALIE